jgi:hypothetical protein
MSQQEPGHYGDEDREMAGEIGQWAKKEAKTVGRDAWKGFRACITCMIILFVIIALLCGGTILLLTRR